jgi:hypothetical protein
MQQVAFYLQLIVILGAATALACWAGWGLARLALPEALHPYRALLAPLLGYAVIIVVGYWFVRTVSGLPLALAVLLPVTGALNLVAWRRGGPPRLGATLREQLPLLLLLFATLIVGIAPLLHYGHPAVIGAGWDIETALPTARYLERGSIAAIGQAAPNPLRDLVRDPPRIGKTVGFAVWQGSLSVLTRIEEILTFAPLLAWLRMLGVLAVYLLFRTALGLQRGPALLGAAWTSAGALMLWISYFNFEKQLAAWPLIPLGLLLAVAAVEDTAARGGRAWPSVLMAAIGLAAMAVAYYPALTLWAPLACGLAAAILIQAPNRARLLGAALALVAATTLIGAPTIIDYWRGFAFRYNEQLTSLGVLRYIPATDILGLTAYIQGQRSRPLTPPWALAGLVALAGLMLVGLIIPGENQDRRQETGDKRQEIRSSPVSRLLSLVSPLSPSRSWLTQPVPVLDSSGGKLRWLGMAVGVLMYLAWLRWWQQYPYAYLKGSAYAGFVFMGLAAAGWQAISIRLAPRLRLAAAAAPLLLLGLMLASQARIVGIHWARPGLYPENFPALLELRQIIPAGSTVTLADNLRTEGVTSGLAAYMLDQATVWGHVKTGYTSATTGAPDALGEYGLLPASEDPTIWGYQEQIWSGGSYALYRRPPHVLAQLRPETLLAPGQSLTFVVGAERLSLKPAALPGGPVRQIELTLATAQDSTISLDGKIFAIPAGAAQVRRVAPTGRMLELHNTGATPLLLRSIALANVGDVSADAVQPLRAALVTSAHATTNAQTVTTILEALLPDGGPLTLAVDIWDSRRGNHYGWYGITLNPGARVQTATFSLDLRSGAAQMAGGAEAALPFGAQFEGLREGDYTAHLNVSAGAGLLAPPSRLFSFRVGRDGAISRIETQAIPLLMTTTDRPPQPLDAHVGDDIRLLGYALDKTGARPGDTCTLTLWWEAQAVVGDERSVLVHLLNSNNAIATQADGAPAHGTRPTSQWRAGDIVIDSHQIALPADLPPGEYTLVVGMYRWPSLERLALRIGDTRQADDVVRIPISISR